MSDEVSPPLRPANLHSAAGDDDDDDRPSSAPASADAKARHKAPRTVQLCPLCRRLRRHFVCSCCVNDCYAFRNKKVRLRDQLALRQLLADQCEQLLRRRSVVARHDLVVELDRARPRLLLLRKARSAMNAQLEHKRRRLADLVNEVNYRTEIVSYLEDVCQRSRCQQQERQCYANDSLVEADKRLIELTNCRCRLVQQLFENVFPIEVVSSDSKKELYPQSASANESAVLEALSEATAVHYCFDRWILMDEISKVKFRVVGYCMAPDHSDYSLLKQFLFNLKTDAPSASNTLFTISKCAFGSCPSLAYASQLCLLLSRLLDVHLPFTLRPTDFCMENICKDEFETAVLKLNANVAVLCCSRRSGAAESVSLCRPFMALVNLRANVDQLHAVGPFRVAGELLADFEKALQRTNWVEKEAPQDVGQTESEDWESVSEALPEWTDNGNALVNILNSATTSVTSFFKAMHM